MKIIGIHGKKRSGKDALCEKLIEEFGPTAYRKAFADALKLEVAHACDVSVEHIEKHKENFRLILQGWGTDFRRKLYGHDYWIKVMEEVIHHTEKVWDLLIVPDVRFLNEYNFLKNKGAVMVHIIRNVLALDMHESERIIDAKFDFVVDNNGNIEKLNDVAKRILSRI